MGTRHAERVTHTPKYLQCLQKVNLGYLLWEKAQRWQQSPELIGGKFVEGENELTG